MVTGTSAAASWSTVPTGTIGWLNVIERNGASPTSPVGWTRSTSSVSGVAGGASTSPVGRERDVGLLTLGAGDRLGRPVELGGRRGVGVERRKPVDDLGDGVGVERRPLEQRERGGGSGGAVTLAELDTVEAEDRALGSSGSLPGPAGRGVTVVVVASVGSGPEVVGAPSSPRRCTRPPGRAPPSVAPPSPCVPAIRSSIPSPSSPDVTTRGFDVHDSGAVPETGAFAGCQSVTVTVAVIEGWTPQK